MALDSIIEWASRQPDWQQDALRRVALSTVLAAADTSAILANLKRAKGLPPEEKLISQPLKKGHLQPDARKAPLARLCSIDDVKNANRLAPDQTLKFALDGITLIYGHNGSGKSGYCRILKKFCRAIVKDTIYPNVFAPGNPPPAEARIRYKVEGATNVSETTWLDGADGPGEIAHLSVFDSHNARLYVDERETGLITSHTKSSCLRVLDNCWPSFKKIFQQKLESLTSASMSVFQPATHRALLITALVNRLTSKRPLARVADNRGDKCHGTWTDENAKDLATLQNFIGNDPKALADRCRRAQNIASNLIEELTRVQDTLSQAKAKELEQAVSHARATAEAASLAATTLFKAEPLPHIGSGPWQLMFRHAKEYSKLAYPDIEPPATREGDLCVLCQQPLAEEAAERLRRFENYVAGEARKDAEKAAEIRDEQSAAIKALQVRSSVDVKSLLGEFTDISNARAETSAAVENLSRRHVSGKRSC